MGTSIADLVLQILSFVAQNERENIRKRQLEGIVAARVIGVRLGRPEQTIDYKLQRTYTAMGKEKLILASLLN